MDNLTAKIRISGKPSDCKFISSHRKEQHFYKEIAAYSVGGEELVTARFYATASRIYCAVWIHCPAYAPPLRYADGGMGNAFNLSGTGWAGGYGYCRASAALAEAITNAGVDLSSDIDGRGLEVGKDAISAICQAMGFKPVPPFTTGAGEVVATMDIVTAPYFFITQANG